jgi:hypothetical protein
MRIAMALLALALATTACKKKETKPAEPTTGSAEVAGSADPGSAAAGSAEVGSAAAGSAEAGSAAAGSADAATQMSRKAGNCPSTVFGATTKAELKGKDVVLTITSADKDAIATIQRRTEELIAEKKDGAGSAAGGHDQKGTHGGGAGICPVHVPEGATAKAKNEKNGVAITITPKDKPDALKTEIDARITKASEWVKANVQAGDKGTQGGVGGGKGEHGGTHSGEGDAKGVERKKGGGSGADTGGGGGKGTGGGGSKGTGGGSGAGSAAK